MFYWSLVCIALALQTGYRADGRQRLCSVLSPCMSFPKQQLRVSFNILPRPVLICPVLQGGWTH